MPRTSVATDDSDFCEKSFGALGAFFQLLSIQWQIELRPPFSFRSECPRSIFSALGQTLIRLGDAQHLALCLGIIHPVCNCPCFFRAFALTLRVFKQV